MKNKKKKWSILICSIVFGILLIGVLLLAMIKLNKYTLEIGKAGEVHLEYGIDKKLPALKANCSGKFLHKKGFTVPVKVDGSWSLKKLGSYPVTFKISFGLFTLNQKGVIVVEDTLPPEITLVSNPDSYTSPAAQYIEEGYTAIDLYDGDITDKVVREERDGKVYYTVTDSQGNRATKERVIQYSDKVAPIITLNKGDKYQSQLKQAYSEPGFTAIDDCDGDITSKVTVEGSVDGFKAGTYILTYRVSDVSGNVAEVKRTVTVTDLQGPAITLGGEREMYLKLGTPYTEPGYAASDSLDGDLTAKVQVSGSVDTGKMGYNTLTYTISDSSGYTATATRNVFVYEKQAVSAAEHPGDKVVYLTFDDGPSAHTARLLDILDKYGVKATFFVTNQFPRFQPMIGETHRRGHTIALHTYSHQYAQVYASEAAYYQDLANINSVVVAQTGVAPTIVRFPGGTNNTVSRHYCTGIMRALSRSLAYHGYLYCDWNVSSGDAGGAKTVDAIANNVINGIQRQNVSVVLQHDIHANSVTAVEKILFWGIQNGYTFLPMSEKTPLVQFSPLN